VSVALIIQHAKRMRRIILSSVAYLGLTYFITLFHKRHDFQKKFIEHKIVFDILYHTRVCVCETFLILRRIQQDIIKNVYRYSCKVPVILVALQSNLNFLNRFSKHTQTSNFLKIWSMGAVLSHADRQANGQTDRHDGANWQFCERA
jgi:hypothetical protein